MQVDEGADIGLRLPGGGVNTSLDLLSGELSEPALDLKPLGGTWAPHSSCKLFLGEMLPCGNTSTPFKKFA